LRFQQRFYPGQQLAHHGTCGTFIRQGTRWLIEWEVLPQQICLHPTGFDWFAEFSVFFEAEHNAQKLMQMAN
jgi:hypothetical protein